MIRIRLNRTASDFRRLLRAYLSRRSPWGPPWWIYGVAFGAANLLRQAAIILTSPDLSPAAKAASWVATALLVLGLINGVAVVRRRLARVKNPSKKLADCLNGPSKEAIPS